MFGLIHGDNLTKGFALFRGARIGGFCSAQTADITNANVAAIMERNMSALDIVGEATNLFAVFLHNPMVGILFEPLDIPTANIGGGVPAPSR